MSLALCLAGKGYGNSGTVGGVVLAPQTYHKIASLSHVEVPKSPPKLQLVVLQPTVSCGPDPSMAYIYQVESGCSTDSYNPGGCRGLGQACPGSKLPCSDYDWACQDSWFKNYAITSYGSIYNAYLFRIGHNYW